MKYLNLPVLAAAALVASTLSSQATPPYPHSSPSCQPGFYIDGYPCACDSIHFSICGEPGCFVGAFMSFQPDAIPAFGTVIPLGVPFFPIGGGMIPPTGDCFEIDCKLPNHPGVEFYIWGFGAEAPGGHLTLIDGPSRKLRVCDPMPQYGCVVIMDEDTIDNGISSIEAAAYSHGVTPDWLVNDDRPTEYGNPWLRWNRFHAGDIVRLPAGQVDDEGIFALPEHLPWSLQDYVDGRVPQSRLDEIYGVMPIRNQELAWMLGETCIAVVYDSDISMNYHPIQGNLQGERYGLFAFTVLQIVTPDLPESRSSTSLYDLIVRVEPPLMPTTQRLVPIHDHEPDDNQIITATWRNGTVTVTADSDFGRYSRMTCSIDGFTFESPMEYVGNDTYRYTSYSPNSLRGRIVTVQTDHGGAYREYVQ